MNPVICKNTTYGQHIVVKCVHHPEKKWTTKNIGNIGDRSFFYKSWGCNPSMGPECSCPIDDLVHDHVDDAGPEGPK